MVLMLDNYDSFTYNLVQYLGELGVEVVTHRNDCVSVDDIERLKPERIVISPGPCTPDEAGISLELIRRFAGRLPILGVCLGHQAIGQAFGGRVIRADEVMHGKTSPVQHTGEGLFAGLTNPFTATRYHSLVVEWATLPECLEVTAWTCHPDGRPHEIMGLRHRTLAVAGVQFHPESILTQHGHALLKNFLTMPAGGSLSIQAAIARAVAGADLDAAEMSAAFRTIMEGEATPAQIGGLLVALRVKGETVTEIAAAAQVMREFALTVDVAPEHLVDTCGTGGDGAGLFNVSTAAAFVVAAAGGRVAKHGNRSVSSASGSADVLEALGVRIELPPQAIARCIDAVGFGFLFAPAHHRATRHALGPRRELGIRTLFNLLGPLTNPARPPHQVVGVYSAALVEPIAQVLGLLGSRHVLVVHADDGLDEISLGAATQVAELKDGAVCCYRIEPEQFGLARVSSTQLAVTDPLASMSVLRAVLAGEPGPARDIVALNAGAALYVAGLADSLAAGVGRAQDLLASGAGLERVHALATLTHTLTDA